MYQEGWPAANKLPQEYQVYYEVQDNIHIDDKTLFLGSKIVVPTPLQPYGLNLVHEGHGRSKTAIYWPRMSTDIEQYVSRCRTCEKFRRANRRKPLIHH
ncbi:hypothetical protein PR048_005641 [Dryococelus australis]|uniref:RNA-directed DNA polymerase n=1 Tax=Dryococelus australis TaxID=614101 RepID=A0ABQ9I8T8_9NEOP|nr:hypothetical protein PR048_005641 [Dryococelus australis]